MIDGGHALYMTAVDPGALWEVYLKSFPPGLNPVYRTRTEHDCQACKHFIRQVGGIVGLRPALAPASAPDLVSLWDGECAHPGYHQVAQALGAYVKAHPIAGPFLSSTPTIGAAITRASWPTGVTSWEHFFLHLPPSVVVPKGGIDRELGQFKTSYDMLTRGMEITVEACETVLGLIDEAALYRGAEHRATVERFLALRRAVTGLATPQEVARYLWSQVGPASRLPLSVARIRNTVIGTLLLDLSSGAELEQAVSAFEAKVAPQNYKRPVALVTQGMVEAARATVEALGLLPALDRRHARATDLAIPDVLFADRSVPHLQRDVFAQVAAQSPVRRRAAPTGTIPVETFLTEVVPTAATIEVLFEPRHAANLVTLVAPGDKAAPSLFPWDNGVSWSYAGEVADTIKARVQKAGGRVEGDVCCRLAWWNHDDLDLHMREPGGCEIYYGNKGRLSPSGGLLDVDMNVYFPLVRDPVENIAYASKEQMHEGVYTLFVHNYNGRESQDVGFEVEVDLCGAAHRFAYAKKLRTGERVDVVSFRYTSASGFVILESLPEVSRQREIWGLTTETFVPVQTLCLSPNHWGGRPVGNKHYFFLLAGCRAAGRVRGFYNEFLRPELSAHRKAFEVIGARLTVPPSADQLSGLGFSSTKPETLVVRVTGRSTRVMTIAF